MKVGVCEDQEAIRNVLARGLREAGHDVLTAHDGGEALRLFGGDAGLDVIVMDIGLPDSDGRDVVAALKSAGQHAPVLFLTALSDIHEVISGFAAGADDFVSKPFDLRVLLVRLEAMARRGSSNPPDTTGLVLDPTTHSMRTEHGQILLTPTEFRVLAAITSRPGEVVRRRAVVAAAWPDGAEVSENTIDSFMRRVRSKLESIGSPVSIETVRGVGFRIS